MILKIRIKALLVALLCFSSIAAFAYNGVRLTSSTLVATHTVEQLKQKFKEKKIPSFLVKLEFDVEVYEILYQTQLPNGAPVMASGLYFVPKGAKGNLPVIVYHHGTQVEKHRESGVLYGEQAICTSYSTTGYTVIMPDYIGLGKGEGMHMYLHAESEAQASIDMIRAVREFNKTINVATRADLFITGYSQGGHAAMSLHKIIEEKFANEFTVLASAPMSGAYDMDGVQSEVMFHPYSFQGYLPYLIYSYNRVYNIYDDPNKVFKAPYDTSLAPMFDGTHTLFETNDIMPSIPKDAMIDSLVDSYVNNPNDPFKLRLRENSVANWKPNAPMQMCYCKGDKQVVHENALVAQANMKKLGAKNIKALMVDKKLGHRTCAMFAAIHTKMYFDSFLKGSKTGRKGSIIKRGLMSIAKKQVRKKATN